MWNRPDILYGCCAWLPWRCKARHWVFDMSETRQQRFWNRVADRYAARPLKNPAAYEAMLDAVAARLTVSDRVLELGCGTGGTAIRLAPGVAVWIATDFSSEMIRIARAKPGAEAVRFSVADAATAFDEGPFDVICAFNLLHLVDDLPELLIRAHDTLRPGGLLITKTWCFADLPRAMRLLFGALRLVGLFPAARMWDGAALLQALDAAGFGIVEERVFGDYPQNPYIVARKPLT